MEPKRFDFTPGAGRLYLLFLLFLGLKLAGEIGWSWIWVFSPLWILPAFALLCFFLAFLLGVFAKRTNAWTEMQRKAKAAARREQLRARPSSKDIDQEYEKLP